MLSKSREDFDRLWPRILEGLCADVGGHPTHTKEGVWARIVSNNTQLWVCRDTVTLTNAQEVPQADRPARVFLNVWVAAGDLNVLRDEIMPHLEVFGRAYGFQGVIGSGREAWGRAMKKEGFKALYTVFLKEFDGGSRTR